MAWFVLHEDVFLTSTAFSLVSSGLRLKLPCVEYIAHYVALKCRYVIPSVVRLCREYLVV